jgi:hypothetical protein
MSKIDPVVYRYRFGNVWGLGYQRNGVQAEESQALYATDPNPLREMIERLANELEQWPALYPAPEGTHALLAEAREMLK